MPAGDRGILSNPEMTQAFRDNVDIAVGIADSLGPRLQRALRQPIDDLLTRDAGQRGTQNLGYAGARPTALVRPCLSNGKRRPRYPLTTAADTIRVIDRVQSEHSVTNLRLLADLYHLHVNGDDITSRDRRLRQPRRSRPDCRRPRGGEPGTGEIPIRTYLEQLAGQGYRGYVGLETRRPNRTPSNGCPGRRAPPSNDKQKRGSDEHNRFHRAGNHGQPNGMPPGQGGHTVVGVDTSPERAAALAEAEQGSRIHRAGGQGRRRGGDHGARLPSRCRASCWAMRRLRPRPARHSGDRLLLHPARCHRGFAKIGAEADCASSTRGLRRRAWRAEGHVVDHGVVPTMTSRPPSRFSIRSARRSCTWAPTARGKPSRRPTN